MKAFQSFPRRISVYCLFGLLLVLTPIASVALAAENPLFGYRVDLPVGWTGADTSDPYHIGFFSPNSDAMVQILALDAETGENGPEIAQVMLEQIQGEGETEGFYYQGLLSSLTDVTFVTSGMQVRGYMVCINAPQADYVLLAFAVEESYDTAHDHLLSAIDSFSIGPESAHFPGPISQFYYPYPGPVPRTTGIEFLGTSVDLIIDPAEPEATTVTVEREARILEPYGALDRETFTAAWRRFFRMLYRDSYMRLEGLSRELVEALEDQGIPRVDYPHELLRWLQGFDYQRTGGLSDFAAPLSCLVSSAGDCDSLALTYVILLHHMGIESIIMVSDRYSHAMAGVASESPGARFSYEGVDWLVAELTTQVELGQINAQMADPAGWIGVRLRLAPVEPAE